MEEEKEEETDGRGVPQAGLTRISRYSPGLSGFDRNNVVGATYFWCL